MRWASFPGKAESLVFWWKFHHFHLFNQKKRARRKIERKSSSICFLFIIAFQHAIVTSENGRFYFYNTFMSCNLAKIWNSSNALNEMCLQTRFMKFLVHSKSPKWNFCNFHCSRFFSLHFPISLLVLRFRSNSTLAISTRTSQRLGQLQLHHVGRHEWWIQALRSRWGCTTMGREKVETEHELW